MKMESKMRRSLKIKAVYHELRQSLQEVIPAKQVLEIADDLVELYSEDSKDVHVDFRTGGVKFFEREADAVMIDGGWSLLAKTDPEIWQQEETERFEIQSAWHRSGVSDQFIGIRI